jgi:hypothetical protein
MAETALFGCQSFLRTTRVAVLFTKTYGRVLAPGLIVLDPKLPDSLKQHSPLATRQLDDALDNFANRQLLAA